MYNEDAIGIIELAIDAYEPGMTATNCIFDVTPDYSAISAAKIMALGATANAINQFPNMHATKQLGEARLNLRRIETLQAEQV